MSLNAAYCAPEAAPCTPRAVRVSNTAALYGVWMLPSCISIPWCASHNLATLALSANTAEFPCAWTRRRQCTKSCEG